MKRPFVVAVTGGIGAGKSTVCALFHSRHAIPTIDADQVAREVVAPGAPSLAQVVAVFGPQVLAADGTLDRAVVRGIVFADDSRRRELESIIHPAIRARMRELLDAVTAPYCLLGIPLLVEGGGRHELVDRVLVVDCPTAAQVERVRARDHLTDAEVAAIMRTQASREARLRIADDVILNDGDPDALTARVDQLHELYLYLGASET